MTNFSNEIIDCLASWTNELQNCKKDPKCIEECGKELRKRLDLIFPPSTKLEFDNDKISYIFSTLFFLSSRLNKALVGLAETDMAINNMVSEERSTISNNDSNNQDRQKFQDTLNKILSDYY
jgi:hypothetical protein